MAAKALYVAGRFDESQGKASKIGLEVFSRLRPLFDFDYKNGGSFRELEGVLARIKEYKVVFWFADVPNDKPKLIGAIKEANPPCLLITSKRNTEGQYTVPDLVYHALGIKSNLFVEFTSEQCQYKGRVMDPLGNVFLDHNENFALVAQVLGKRVEELSSFTRVSSQRAGERREIPDENDFFDLVRAHGDTFHELIHPHPEAANRFFGNASFRCERGFPSMKAGGLVFVSRRNVDKRFIEPNSFVAVELGLPVRYFGDHKPSVDTPIQIALYSHYSNARYMLHSHTYAEGAPLTQSIVPCGALEEANEIIDVFPNQNEVNFSINLRGHGSLVIADSVAQFRAVRYAARPIPEIHPDYAKDLG